jgi:hypothetical protein
MLLRMIFSKEIASNASKDYFFRMKLRLVILRMILCEEIVPRIYEDDFLEGTRVSYW